MILKICSLRIELTSLQMCLSVNCAVAIYGCTCVAFISERDMSTIIVLSDFSFIGSGLGRWTNIWDVFPKLS